LIRMHREAMRVIKPEHVQTELFWPRRNRGRADDTAKSMALKLLR